MTTTNEHQTWDHNGFTVGDFMLADDEPEPVPESSASYFARWFDLTVRDMDYMVQEMENCARLKLRWAYIKPPPGTPRPKITNVHFYRYEDGTANTIVVPYGKTPYIIATNHCVAKAKTKARRIARKYNLYAERYDECHNELYE